MKKLKLYFDNIISLTDTEWKEAKTLFKTEEILKGGFLIKPNVICNKISFVQSGLFRLYYLVEGEEKTMLFFPENQFATDYFSFLTKTQSIRHIDALEDSIVYSISYDDLHKLFAFKNWETIGRILAERAYVLSVFLANRIIHDNFETRIVNFMKENPGLYQRLPQYMIASYLKMTPETLSRVKKRIQSNIEYKSIHNINGFDFM